MENKEVRRPFWVPLAAWMKRKAIAGCEADGTAESVYLTRVTLLKAGPLEACLHIFHRSDRDDLHNHPWNFVSIILKGGYLEETPRGKSRKYPGMILWRPAHTIHRVELISGRPAVTLVIKGRKYQEWGFFSAGKWIPWRKYFKEKGC